MIEDFNKYIAVNRSFLDRHPRIDESEFTTELFFGEWVFPFLNSQASIKGMGTTNHHAMPTSIRVEHADISIDVMAKPFNENAYIAETEFANTEIARRRGINVPAMVALVVEGDTALLLQELVHNSEVLSTRRLDFKLTDPRVYRPHDFLEEFIGKVAEMHEKGVVHGDLHLGNIGYQYFPEKPAEPIFFDFETSNVLNSHDLVYRNRDMYIPDERLTRIALFEGEAIADLAAFAVNLWCNDFPMRKKKLLTNISDIYQDNRENSSTLLRGKRFYTQLAHEYDRYLKGANCPKRR